MLALIFSSCMKTRLAYIFILIVGLINFLSEPPTYAQDNKLPVLTPPNLSVSIPGLNKLEPVQCVEGSCNIPWLPQYIVGLQKYGTAAIGIIAVIVFMAGGILWLTAGGNDERIGQAKNFIKGSILGVILMLASYVILYILNPNLTQLNGLNVSRVNRIDLDNIIVSIKNGEPISIEQAALMRQFDKDGVISHTVGSDADNYKSLSCDKSIFSGGKAVEFFTTGYYKPPYQNNQKFFCDVGLQCSCPNGSQQLAGNKALCGHPYKYCSPFPSTTDYCTSTASGVKPDIGQIAADTCFSFGDKVCLGGKITLTVTDRGSAIKGRRFDIFSGNDRQTALAKSGVVSVTLGPCK